MKYVFAALTISLCQVSFGGELVWYETKAVDATQQGNQIVSFFGKIEPVNDSV
jgi:hypothetical protein